MLDLTGLRVLFVGGKGGVGKTTTAGAIAVRQAELGRRTLLVSTDPAHSLGDLFGVAIGNRRTELAPKLVSLEIDPEREADQYIATVGSNLRSLVHPEMYAEVDRQMKLARSAPGSVEAAMLERVATIMTGSASDHDVVIFDTAPTGQTLRLLALPEIMTAWTEGLLRHRAKADELGRALQRFQPSEKDHFPFMDETDAKSSQGDKFERIRETLVRRRALFAAARAELLDHTHTAFVLVLNAEKLPILESSKALGTLREFGMRVGGVVVNRILPRDEPGEFLERRRERESRYLEQISELFAGEALVYVPMFPGDVGGVEGVRQVARHIHI